MGAVGQPMAGQNLAHRSTVELIVSRQVPDCVTGRIGSHQRCLVDERVDERGQCQGSESSPGVAATFHPRAKRRESMNIVPRLRQEM